MEKAIKEMGKNKAPGPPHIKNDLLKLITNKSFINHILKILNMMLEMDNLPDEMILAKIILIPKRNDWEGLLSNTRPITLLDTIKKLFSQILTDRITRIINEHHILKGYNFGFTENKSTKDPLIITRTIIDDAKINKKNLNMASLDVQKAYESAPFLSIEQALKRIKVPENFINHVLKILNRNVFIESPAGRTNTFKAKRGLPQGDPMSPILWNIFYDSLLVKLGKRNGYKINKSLSISAIAYADDIHPISENDQRMKTNYKICLI